MLLISGLLSLSAVITLFGYFLTSHTFKRQMTVVVPGHKPKNLLSLTRNILNVSSVGIDYLKATTLTL